MEFDLYFCLLKLENTKSFWYLDLPFDFTSRTITVESYYVGMRLLDLDFVKAEYPVFKRWVLEL